MPLVFPFDPNIARASTIPSRLYNDPVYLELERERIFAHTWQLVGRVDQVSESGQYFTADIGNDAIVILRDGPTLRGFYNICLHRAGPVAYGCGKRHTLQCKYHGWTYTLDGSLLRAPEMEGVEDFRPNEMHLLPVRVATWGPFIIVNQDANAPPLQDVWGEIPHQVQEFGCPIDQLRLSARRDYVIQCNWKVYVDNYLEGYHLPVVHPGLHKELDYDQYKVEPHRYFSIQHAPLRPVHAGARTRRYDPNETDVAEAVYVWLFPNVMMNVYMGQMQTNLVLPLAHDRTKVVFEWFATDVPENPAADARWSRLLEFSDEIQEEDIEICEVVQRNLRSRVYDRGRYSAARENGVHHFHSLLHEFLT